MYQQHTYAYQEYIEIFFHRFKVVSLHTDRSSFYHFPDEITHAAASIRDNPCFRGKFQENPMYLLIPKNRGDSKKSPLFLASYSTEIVGRPLFFDPLGFRFETVHQHTFQVVIIHFL